MNPALLAAMRPRVRFESQPSDTAPGAPSNLRTTSVSSDAVALAWGAPSSGGAVTGYELLRGGVVIQSGITGLSVVDSTVTAGQGYSYTVRAVGPGGVGPESDALAVEVPDAPDPGGDHPNEPAGFSFIAERAYNSLDENGWSDNDGSRCTVQIEEDATGPMSPGSILRHTYSTGYTSGSTSQVGNSRRGLPNVTEVYFHFAMRLSENFQNSQSGVNKLFYLTGAGSGAGGGDPLFFLARSGNPSTFEIMHQNGQLSHAPVQVAYSWNAAGDGEPSGRHYYGNEIAVTLADATLTLGDWNDIEVLIRCNSEGQEDGEIHAWLNGTKILQFTAAEFCNRSPVGILDNFRLEPIWGSGADGQNPSSPFWIDLDHIYISGVS